MAAVNVSVQRGSWQLLLSAAVGTQTASRRFLLLCGCWWLINLFPPRSRRQGLCI